MIYYELCEKVWVGSPPTEHIEGGLESVDLGFCTPWDSKYCIQNKKPKDLVVDSPLF